MTAMKKSILILITVFTSFIGYAQTTKLSATTIRDFAVSFYYKHHIEKSEDVRSWAYAAGNSLGYGYTDVAIGVEQLEKNKVFREAIFKTIYQLCRCDQEMLTLQLIAIGMKATEAKTLSIYILSQYKTTVDAAIEKAKKQQAETEERRFERVEEEADYVGGMTALRNYLSTSLSYPSLALKQGISGTVIVKFTVEKDGSLSEVEVVQGQDLGYGLPEEAVRLISNMPKWKPALQEGKPVKAYRRLPISFQTPDVEDEQR